MASYKPAAGFRPVAKPYMTVGPQGGPVIQGIDPRDACPLVLRVFKEWAWAEDHELRSCRHYAIGWCSLAFAQGRRLDCAFESRDYQLAEKVLGEVRIEMPGPELAAIVNPQPQVGPIEVEFVPARRKVAA